jgi:hypothetical protein
MPKKQTYRQRVAEGHNAGPQGLHVLVVFKNIIRQGVPFQLISCRGNLGLEEEDSGTYPPDVPGPLGA